MARHSRRNFLMAASTAAAVFTLSGRPSAWAQGMPSVRMWSTFGNQRHAKAEAPGWKASAQPAADAIVVNASAAKQDVLGFGVAMTDSSCYVLSQLKDDERQALMHDLFAPGEMAFNVCRTCIGASD